MTYISLWRVGPKVTKKVLLNDFKKMEASQLVICTEKTDFPPHVYWSLSDNGRAFGSALVVKENWANEHVEQEVTFQ